MAFSLDKGENLNLSKTDSSLTRARIGLGWKATNNFDLDACAFLLNAEGKLVNEKGFVFFNNKSSLNGAVKTLGDNRTGTGDGDDETIMINFAELAADTQSIVIAVTIHDAVQRGQNFGQISDAYVRLVNDNTGHDAEIVRFDLSEDASGATAMIFATIYRSDDSWKFKANAEGTKQSLDDLAAFYGA